MRRQPFQGKVSRAVLALLSGPTGDDRRLLDRRFTDGELAGRDPVARGFAAPVPADELAERRRGRRLRPGTAAAARTELGRAAP